MEMVMILVVLAAFSTAAAVGIGIGMLCGIALGLLAGSKEILVKSLDPPRKWRPWRQDLN